MWGDSVSSNQENNGEGRHLWDGFFMMHVLYVESNVSVASSPDGSHSYQCVHVCVHVCVWSQCLLVQCLTLSTFATMATQSSISCWGSSAVLIGGAPLGYSMSVFMPFPPPHARCKHIHRRGVLFLVQGLKITVWQWNWSLISLIGQMFSLHLASEVQKITAFVLLEVLHLQPININQLLNIYVYFKNCIILGVKMWHLSSQNSSTSTDIGV